MISGWQKKDPAVCCLQETNFKFKGRDSLKVGVWKKVFHVISNKKKARVAIFL